ncbi:MAG: hypothetical protein DRO99_02315, partial [Candidatus Aenigmatarchaeota archaeon]
MEEPRVVRVEGLDDNSIVLGRRFLFLLPGLSDSLGFAGIQLPSIMNMIGDDEVNIMGLKVQKSSVDEVPIAGVCPVKMLFSPDETAYILVSYPLKAGENVTVSITSAGRTVDSREVELDSLGCHLHAIRGLAEGDYTASIEGTEVSSSFTVARYQLAPMQATFLWGPESADRGKKVRFGAELLSFSVPVEGDIRVELMSGRRRVSSQTVTSHEGAVSVELEMPEGEDAVTVNFIKGEKSASLPIRGGRESERTPFKANPLGRVFEVSTLPPGDEARGLYVSRGPSNNEPFGIRSDKSRKLGIVGDRCTIYSRSKDVQCAKVVVVDPVTRELTELDMGRGEGGQVTFEVPEPYGMAFIGAVIDGKAYEAYAMAVRPSSLAIELDVQGQAEPGEDITVGISTNQPDKEVAVLVTAVDGRSVAPDTMMDAFASRIKSGAEQMANGMEAGTVDPGTNPLRPANVFGGYIPPLGDDMRYGNMFIGSIRATAYRGGPDMMAVRSMAPSGPELD